MSQFVHDSGLLENFSRWEKEREEREKRENKKKLVKAKEMCDKLLSPGSGYVDAKSVAKERFILVTLKNPD